MPRTTDSTSTTGDSRQTGLPPSDAADFWTFLGSNLTVRRFGYGAMQLAGPGVWGPPPDRAGAIAVLRAAVNAGIDHIDTADFYGPHETNHVIREALHPYPPGLTIATKVGYRRGSDQSWQPDHGRAAITAAVHANLTHLGLEQLPLVNLRLGGANGVGPHQGPIAEPMEALLNLQRRGLIRHLGLSNVDAAQVAEARRLGEIVAVQNHYNLAHRADDALIDALAADGIAYTPFFPLGGFSPLQSSALDEVARSLDATPLQVALAWLLQRSPNILLIPGTSSVAHLRQNLAAARLALSPDALATLSTIGDPDRGSSGH